jgi:hypothetical protein
MNAEYMIGSWPVRRNPHWWSPIIYSAYGVNVDKRMLDKIVCSWQKWYASIITTICFITLLIIGAMTDSFHSSGNSSLFQIEIISLWISVWIILPPLWWILLESDHSLTPCIFNSWEKWFRHLAQILWESATRSPFSSFTTLFLGWYPLLKSLIPLYKSLILFFLLFVSSSLILAFRYSFFLFVKCLLVSHLTLCRLSPLFWFGFCNH